jgi:hypothetical protein
MNDGIAIVRFGIVRASCAELNLEGNQRSLT